MTTPQNIEQLIAEAKAAYEAEEYSQAITGFEAAEQALKANGDLLNAAEMANNRSVALLKSSKPADALACIESTDQVFAQAGDPKRQAMALGNQATALEELGRTDDALAKYHQSVDIFKQIGESDMAALVLKRISSMQYRVKDRAAAMSTMVDALNLQSKLGLQDRILKWLLGIVGKMSAR